MESAPSTLSLRIHVVLYQLTPVLLDRFLNGAARAVSLAKASGRISTASLQVGDCSPEPTWTSQQIEAIASTMQEKGLDEFGYRFFNANLGSAGGHNALLADFDADLVLIINPDTVAAPQALNEMLIRLGDSAYGRGDIGIVEARQLPIEHPKAYDPETGETGWAAAACVLLPRRVIQEVGGFDAETFFLYCDDVDLSWRIRLAGYKIVYAPLARVFHDKRATTEGFYRASSAEEYYTAEATVLMAHKYSRPDLVDSYLSLLDAGPDFSRKAADAFRQRRDSGRLPVPLDPEHVVADFPGPGLFAEHRY